MTNRRSYFRNQDYSRLNEASLDSGKLFEDEFFALDVANATWLRPHEIVQDPQFFVGGASRFDVVQGSRSDCWLVVAMANLTTSPKMFDHVVPKDQSFDEGYAGIFRFNIWQCGTWVEVVVDDRLPTKEHKLMFTHSRERNEFWSALLEKAYAKLYGSYNELTVGWFVEAMVDFTGGIVERVNVSDTNAKSIITKSLSKGSFICVFMLNDPKIKEHILPNGLVKGHAYGLTKTLSVTLNGKTRVLLRMRNPWGMVEWNGAWSDGSEEWKSVLAEDRKKIGLVNDDDGEFWIDFSDFSENFEYADICHFNPDPLGAATKSGWEAHFFKGQWTRGVNAGGLYMETFHINPQYRIVLTDTDDDDDNLCTVLVALMQRNKTRTWHEIGFTAFKLDGPEKESKKPLTATYLDEHYRNSLSSEFKARRDIVIRDKWEPGVYVLVPSTVKPNEDGQYLVRFYSEKKASMEETEQMVGSALPAIIEGGGSRKLFLRSDKEISEYFDAIADPSGEIGWESLRALLDYALDSSVKLQERKKVGGLISWIPGSSLMRDIVSIIPGSSIADRLVSLVPGSSLIFGKEGTQPIFTVDECRHMIEAMDTEASGRMSYKEFQVLWNKMRLWEMVFLKYCDHGERMETSVLGQALTEVGYHVENSEIETLKNKYSTNGLSMKFDEFVMCCISASKDETADMVGSYFPELFQLAPSEDIPKLKFKSDQEISVYFDGIADPNGQIGWESLQALLDYALDPSVRWYEGGLVTGMVHLIPGSSIVLGKRTLAPIFTKDECRSLLQVFDTDDSGRMSRKEFQVLWKKLELWETVFVKYCDKGYYFMNSTELGPALADIGYHVKPSEISSLARKYSNNSYFMTFNDFVMCAVSLMGNTI